MGNLFANPGILIFTGICIIQSISRLGVFNDERIYESSIAMAREAANEGEFPLAPWL